MDSNIETFSHQYLIRCNGRTYYLQFFKESNDIVVSEKGKREYFKKTVLVAKHGNGAVFTEKDAEKMILDYEATLKY